MPSFLTAEGNNRQALKKQRVLRWIHKYPCLFDKSLALKTACSSGKRRHCAPEQQSDGNEAFSDLGIGKTTEGELGYSVENSKGSAIEKSNLGI